MPDDLTAFLDLVTSDAAEESMTHDTEDCPDWRNSCTAHNTMRLAAMVRGAAELHAPVDRGRVVRCCAGCEAVNGEFHEDCCHEWPCPTYRAITRGSANGTSPVIPQDQKPL